MIASSSYLWHNMGIYGGVAVFAERFDALMRIAETSNALLGRAVNMNSSHIGRLRSGARALPKKHEYLEPMCSYLASRITKAYQVDALQKLTGLGNGVFTSREGMAAGLAQWLLQQGSDVSAATGRMISGFSRIAARPASAAVNTNTEEVPQKYATCLYGNAGKRKAVEQFFLMILQEEKPQTLLLFSDENIVWLYEDMAFAARWADLFRKVILKGNRVRIIHTVSRDMNELLEAVTKWIPIYMTGAIEPYGYQRLRDGLFQRTMFLAPNTAAIISSSVQQNTDGMLNLFLTDRAAIQALVTEYERYFALCRPLMRVFTGRDIQELRQTIAGLSAAEGAAYLCSAATPLFAMPQALAQALAEQTENKALLLLWKESVAAFRKTIATQSLTVCLPDPEQAVLTPAMLTLFAKTPMETGNPICTQDQVLQQYEHLQKLAERHENLRILMRNDLEPNMLLYVKEDTGVVMAKTDAPMAAFVIHERNMINAFWDYMNGKCGQ